MKGKKILALFTAATCLAMPLTACNGGSGDGDVIKLQIMENDVARQVGYVDVLLNAFNEAYAEEGIVAVDANLDQYTDLENLGPHGYGPDVLYQANDQIMKYCKGRHIRPIDTKKIECYDTLPENAKSAFYYTLDGQQYTMGVGVNVQAPMLCYRKDIIDKLDWQTKWDDDKNGVADFLEDWRALYRLSYETRENNGWSMVAGKGRYGYMAALNDQYFSLGYLFTYGAYVFGDNNTNPQDVGFHNGEAEKGARIIYQLAELMNSGCSDHSISSSRKAELAKGNYLFTSTTPDTYEDMINGLIDQYKIEGKSEADAKTLARENMVMTTFPKLPSCGDLTCTDKDCELIDAKQMGGINGYAVSSYSKNQEACLKFIDFATSKEMITLRNQYCGIAAVRPDVVEEVGGFTEQLFAMIEKGQIDIMPSISEVDSIWTSTETMFKDISADPFRDPTKKKYKTGNAYGQNIDMAKLKTLLNNTSTAVLDEINSLKN